ncbi:MAG: hypothetical protein P1U56_24300 [Saprospiraceae bacterium]|nr:hypothetical protein [Saprospiraceae bacterium]
MNIKKVEKQLRKINQLFENIKEDGVISPIEKDLMLSYVRSLYEKMLDSENSTLKGKKVEKELPVKEVIKQEPKTMPAEEANPIAQAVFQDVIQKEDVPVSNETDHTQAEVRSAAPKQEMIVEVESPEEVKKTEISEELSQLFTFESTKELSDKLSRSPISDLTKSMGINEKIFTVQELFGGDSSLFSRTMESLDKMSSLEQARDFLVEHVAVDQNWTAEGKVKKAANFIKLISRRY